MSYEKFVSQKTDEHYTPPEVLALVIKCLGSIHLDPCSNSHADPNVPAKEHYTIADDGLIQDWVAQTVFMNPPFSKNSIWIDKLIKEYRLGNIKEAIALVKADTSTRWFQPLWDYPICFCNRRLRFVGNGNSALFASALVYFGNNPYKFQTVFNDTLGVVAARCP